MIEVQNIVKDFRKTIKKPGLAGSVRSLFKPEHETVRAVDGVSFGVEEGEILGFIGPNGAGKSTVIKMLTGILTPTSGSCRINGYVPQKDRKRYVREIGVVFGQRTQLWWDLPLTETYTVLKEIYDIPAAAYKQRMDFLTEVLDLSPFISSPVRTLSLGQRMRADIAASMLHNPRVLFLDEPTIGLDIVVKDNIRKAIREINKNEKTTIILTTHDLSDIELLCKRIVLIDKGKLVFDGDLARIKETFAKVREISFMLENEGDWTKLPFAAAGENGTAGEKPSAFGDDFSVERDGARVTLRFGTDATPLPEMLSRILASAPIADIAVKDIDIEEILRRVYRKQVTL